MPARRHGTLARDVGGAVVQDLLLTGHAQHPRTSWGWSAVVAEGQALESRAARPPRSPVDRTVLCGINGWEAVPKEELERDRRLPLLFARPEVEAALERFVHDVTMPYFLRAPACREVRGTPIANADGSRPHGRGTRLPRERLRPDDFFATLALDSLKALDLPARNPGISCPTGRCGRVRLRTLASDPRAGDDRRPLKHSATGAAAGQRVRTLCFARVPREADRERENLRWTRGRARAFAAFAASPITVARTTAPRSSSRTRRPGTSRPAVCCTAAASWSRSTSS